MDKQMDSSDALSRSCYRERRLNNIDKNDQLKVPVVKELKNNRLSKQCLSHCLETKLRYADKLHTEIASAMLLVVLSKTRHELSHEYAAIILCSIVWFIITLALLNDGRYCDCRLLWSVYPLSYFRQCLLQEVGRVKLLLNHIWQSSLKRRLNYTVRHNYRTP